MEPVLLRVEGKKGQWDRCLYCGEDSLRLSRKQMDRLLKRYPLKKGCIVLKQSDITVYRLDALAWDHARLVLGCK